MLTKSIKELRILRPLRTFFRKIRVFPAKLFAAVKLKEIKRAGHDKQNVCYVTKQFPQDPLANNKIVLGGAVKIDYLARKFKHSFPETSLLYVVSSVEHPSIIEIVDKVKQLGIPIVLNQNGVYYEAWYGEGWEEMNKPLAYVHSKADYILYQSDFCRRAANKFLGPTNAKYEVLYNPVDLDRFSVQKNINNLSKVTFLAIAAAGWRSYRITIAVRTIAELRKRGLDVDLLIPGYDHARDKILIENIYKIAQESNLDKRYVIVRPPFTREEAPSIFNLAHILLHPVCNDPSPNIVGESMACGLPVVYLKSGGVPEIVGERAGEGLEVEERWDRQVLPDVNRLADLCEKVISNMPIYSGAATERAGQLLNLEHFYNRHESIFSELLSDSGRV